MTKLKGLKKEIETGQVFLNNAALLRKSCKIALVSGKIKGFGVKDSSFGSIYLQYDFEKVNPFSQL